MVQPETTASFGYWVRRQRLALDLTQADLARMVGCARVTVSKIERDERRPSRQMAELLAKHLAVPAEERARFLAAALSERSIGHLALAGQPLSTRNESAHPLPTNLPAPTTPFVGRRQELAQLFADLENPDCRLLTLVGPGGFGKTRLSIRLGELASERPDLFPDGVFFVALEDLDDRALVVPTIAGALEFAFYEHNDVTEQLVAYLARKRLLLILDNAEEVLDGALLAALMEGAPAVTFLVTSREALHLQQEWFHPLAGMAINGTTNGQRRNDDLTADAVQLFALSARQAQPSFRVTEEIDHVVQICRLVDGAPLALELAASWLRAAPCARIASELQQSLDILQTSSPDVPPRHRNVQTVLEHSWARLSDAEQQLFNELTVFVGGFDAEAAEQVAGASLWGLASLVEQSMLQLGSDGRYRIHTLLTKLGRAKLRAQPARFSDVRARHCDYYISFLRARSRTIAGRAQAHVMDDIALEFDNIRAAWRVAAQEQRVTDLASVLPVLFRFLWVKGRFVEGEALCEEARSRLNPQDHVADDASLLWTVLSAYRAQFLAALARHEEAASLLEQAQTVAETSGDRSGLALCHCVAGIAAKARWELKQSIAHLDTAYRFYRELDDNRGLAETAFRLGYARSVVGESATCEALIEESVQRFYAEDDLSSAAEALDSLGAANFKLGHYDAGKRHYETSLAFAEEVDNQLIVAKSTGGLAFVASVDGEWGRCSQLMEKRLQLMERIGHIPEVSARVLMLCDVYVSADQCQEALALSQRYPQIAETPPVIEAFVDRGAHEQAWTLLARQDIQRAVVRYEYTAWSLLIAWAKLLRSPCKLVRVETATSATMPLTEEERQRQAAELLNFVAQWSGFPAFARARGAKLRTQLLADAASTDVDSSPSAPPRSIGEIVRELETIRPA